MGIGDSGTAGFYACLNSKVVDVKPSGIHSIKVALANGSYVHSAHVGYLPNQNLPLQAILVHLFPNLNKVILYLGQLCDAVMKIILTKTQLIAVMDGESDKVMLEGARAKYDGIWCVNLDNGDKAGDAVEAMTKKINANNPINKIPAIKPKKSIIAIS